MQELFSYVTELNNNGVKNKVCYCQGNVVIPGTFSCQGGCNAPLKCGNHACESLCHAGECDECPFRVDMTCECGKFAAAEFPQRLSCLDPAKVCGETCGKSLGCGPDNDPHTCTSQCHAGPCHPCGLESVRRCRCGKFLASIQCTNININLLCNNYCRKGLKCSNHRK